MAQKHPKKNTIGLNIILTAKDQAGAIVNISSASTKNLVFVRPDGTTFTRAGAFVTDGGDGKLKYVTQSGDLNQAGDWEIEADIVLAGGFAARSSKIIMAVDPLAEEAP